MNRLHLFACVSLCAISPLYSYPAFAKQQATTGVMPTRVYDNASVFRKDDARLEKKVSVDYPLVHGGQLLETFAQQTGVSIEASDADGAASEELVAVLKDMPLADAMECLTSLLSHRNARWQWRREGNGVNKPYVYRLVRPANAIGLYAEQEKALVQADFEKEADGMIAGLDMSQEEVKRKAKDDPRLSSLLNDKSSPLGIRAFRDCLTAEQRADLIHGNKPQGVQIPLQSLNSAGQQLEAYMHTSFQQINPGHEFNVPSATFSITNINYPRLVISFGDLGGWTYLGGKTLQAKAVRRELDNWIHENETKTDDSYEAQTLPKPKDRDKTDTIPGNNQMPARFAYMGEAGSFSVLARLERDPHGGSAQEPWEVSIGEFLKGNVEPYDLLRKWHKNGDGKDVLLVDYMGWYRQDTDPQNPRLPWNVVKKFHRGEVGVNNESLTVAILYASAVLEQSNQQLRLVKEEYPLSRWMFSNNTWLQPLAQFVVEKPERYTNLISPEGIPFKAMPNALRIALLDSKQVLGEDQSAVISGSARLVLQPDGSSESFRLEVRDDKGNILTTVSAPNATGKTTN